MLAAAQRAINIDPQNYETFLDILDKEKMYLALVKNEVRFLSNPCILDYKLLLVPCSLLFAPPIVRNRFLDT